MVDIAAEHTGFWRQQEEEEETNICILYHYNNNGQQLRMNTGMVRL